MKYLLGLIALMLSLSISAQTESLKQVSIDTAYSVDRTSYIDLKDGNTYIIVSKHYSSYYDCEIYSVSVDVDGEWEEAHAYLVMQDDGKYRLDMVYDAFIDNYYNVKLIGS